MQTTELLNIKKHCFVNAPWYELKEKYLDLFIEHRIQPEIGLEGNCLYDEGFDEFEKIALLLKKNKLSCTLHAPFFDLAPGALDPYILEKSRDKLDRAFALLSIFHPRSIVCHLQFEENKHGYVFDRWLLRALETWKPLLLLAQNRNIPIMFENTFEKTPSAHMTVLKELNSPYAKFCLDVGHLMAFSNSQYQEWLPALAPWLGQLHLHDNNGETDEHLAPGRGKFNFMDLFGFLKKNKLQPIITFEPHSEENLWETFDYLLATKLLSDILKRA